MKKLLYAFFMLVLIALVYTVPSHAAGEASITITPSAKEVHPGDSVTFTIVAHNPTGKAVEDCSGQLSASQGLTIDYDHYSILCADYFEFHDFTKEKGLNCAVLTKEGTTKEDWDIMSITCKVDDEASVGKKTLTFTVGKFGSGKAGGADLLISKDTPFSATINVTHTGEHTWNNGKETQSPTCTATGVKTYNCTVPGCDGTKTESIPALGHQNLTIKQPFEWKIDSQDKTKATAKTTVKCDREGCEYYNGKEVDVKVSEPQITDATCVKPGTVTFVGTCTIDGTTKEDTHSEEVAALGHRWSEPECVWEGNYVTVTRHCTRGTDQVNDVAHGYGTEIVTGPANCEEDGSHYYKATVTFVDGGDQYTAESEPSVIPATGHNWPETVDFVWNTDDVENVTATAKATCGNEGCEYHNEEQNLTIKVDQTEYNPAKCEDDGFATYSATATTPGTNPKIYSGTTKVTLPKLGHKWSDKVIFTWTETPGNFNAEAFRLCENDSTHTYKGNVTVVKEETVQGNCGYDGKNTYTATATFGDEKTASETKEEIIPATGRHTLADWVTEEAATYKAEGKKSRTCTVCGNKIEVETIPRLEPETNVEVNKGDATVDTTPLENYLDKVVDSVLVGAKPAGMPQEIIDAILAAGNSINPGSLTVSAKLVVDDAANQSITGIDADSILKTYNIHIDVTVNGEGVSDVTGQITETSQPISFTVPKPEGGPIYYVMRDHNGWAKIGSRVDGSNIIFSSNLFSDFSIISSNNLADADVEPIPNQTYTGKEITPKVKVTINGGEELTEGVDYTVTYSNNTEIGTATVVIKAVEGSDARFTGSKTVTFQIVKQADDANGAGATGNGNNKNTSSPATGDEASIALYTVLAIFAAVVAAGVALRRRYQK